ncbi:serine/threonine-protein kinase [Aneurinibacillus migulanus]|uniref:serine/threonine-protein kinase n=1 Tax=Aneurinibacillus migulanus TaxID=47500 RepID=UPI002E1C452A|nr:serine/threonine-protein kinase [Aneurinibacillus migulanus]
MSQFVSVEQVENNDKFYLKNLQRISSNSQFFYRNIKYVGRGGSGTTFRVVCEKGDYVGSEFALKVFYRVSDNTRRRRFLKEISVLQSLNHPGIIKLFDLGTYNARENNYPFMIVEFIPDSIRDLLTKGEISRLKAIRVGLQVLSALNYIHTREKPIIHRDIKPENILVSDDLVKLADFGLIREFEEGVTESDGAVAPTKVPAMPFRYRTPDLIKHHVDNVPPTTASDIYQFGLVLYELLTGWNPQKPTVNILDPIELTSLRIQGLEGDKLVTLIEHMLQEKPGDRPTAAECNERLMEIYLSIQQKNVELYGITG